MNKAVQKSGILKKFWTPEETDLLKALYSNTGAGEIADRLGRSVRSVYSQGRNKEEIEAFKSNRPLIELKRNQIKLSRTIKMLEK
ncbi:MAG: hypothetical protein LBL04_14065 [Bacteroidales bacterium]|jgi:hypothetical protein|nr:hypothetical protein [Bacteroidales bacterium]